MKVLASLALTLGFFTCAHAAEPKRPPMPKQWPMGPVTDFKRSSDCVSMATFEKLVEVAASNGQAAGFKESQIPRASRLVVSQALCRAYVDQDQHPCDQLRSLKFKPASLFCRSEPYLLRAHYEFHNNNMQGAMEACVHWYDTKREQLSPLLKSDMLCKTVFEEMKADPNNACARIGQKVRTMLGRSTALGIAKLCRTYIAPAPEHCGQKGRGEPGEMCLARYRVLQAFQEKNPAACPSHPLFSGVCRAMISDNPKAQCRKIVFDLMHMYCGK